jgi:pimeloyl-ACP methyl ester carboxylesterase
MKNLESFNKLSKVDNYYSRKTKENLLPDYDGLSYVRLMKLFEPQKVDFRFTFPKVHITDCPSFKQYKSRIENDEIIDLNEEMNKPFHLRCYIPKDNITRKSEVSEKETKRNERKTHRVVIMFNGLNEIEHFDLYDLLGEYFTSNGMSAILLPTPTHLNRRVYREVTDKETGEKITAKFMPTEFARVKDESNKKNIIRNGDVFYYSFLKSFGELRELVARIKGNYDYGTMPNAELEKTFYETYFNHPGQSLEVVLFGYSLGGLRALSYFLHNPEDYRCCISFNSGANLLDSHTAELKIPEDDWFEMLNAVQLKVDNHNSRQMEHNEKEIFCKGKDRVSDEEVDEVVRLRKEFLTFYFGEGDGTVKENVSININRYLAIMGGADRIVNIDQMKNMAPKKKHIHQVIVAGVDHHPTKDPNWYNVLPRIEKNIVDFIETCDEEHWTKERVVQEMTNIVKGIDYFETLKVKITNEKLKYNPNLEFDFNDLYSLLADIEKCKGMDYKNRFIKFYYISKAYYPSFEELIIKINKEWYKYAAD